MPIIHDENWTDFQQQDSGFMPRESLFGELEGVPMFAEAIELIAQAEWPSRIALMNREKAFPRFRYEEKKPVHQYQNGHPTCWAYSLTQAQEMTDVVNHNKYVELAPESLCEVTGWRDRGYFCDRALQHAKLNGIAERSFVPQYSLDYRNYKSGWKENALKHRPVEVFDLGRYMWPEVVTALLSGFTIYSGYNRFGHAIDLDSLVYENNRVGVSSPNTWQPKDRWTLFGKVAVPDEAFALRTVVVS